MASRRMGVTRSGPVAVLRDARKNALLRTRLEGFTASHVINEEYIMSSNESAGRAGAGRTIRISRAAKSATACTSTGTCRSPWTTAWCCARTCSGPSQAGNYPVILSYGPYAKGLAFQEGYPSAWQRMVAEAPRRRRRIDQQVPELGSGRSGEMGAARLCLRARRFPRLRLLARR